MDNVKIAARVYSSAVIKTLQGRMTVADTNTTTTETVKPLVAADLLKSAHPLNATFVAWLNGKEATKRQARKFLAENPQYLKAKQA
jgi:hypothetical protein